MFHSLKRYLIPELAPPPLRRGGTTQVEPWASDLLLATVNAPQESFAAVQETLEQRGLKCRWLRTSLPQPSESTSTKVLPPEAFEVPDIALVWSPDPGPGLGERVRSALGAGETLPVILVTSRPPDSGAEARWMDGVDDVLGEDDLRALQDLVLSHLGRIVQGRVSQAVLPLRRQLQHFHLALDNAGVVVAHCDRMLRFTWVFNADSDSIRGKRPEDVLPTEQATPLVTQMERVVARDEGERAEHTLTLTANGEARIYDVLCEPLRSESGDQVGLTLVAVDVTGRRRAEDALRTAESQLNQLRRVEAVGRLAGGVAHDFNNNLAVVMLVTQRLLREHADDPALVTRLDRIQEAAQRASSLTRRLLAVGRREILRPEVVDLRELIRSLLPLFQRSLPAGIRLRTDLQKSPVLAQVDIAQMEQVVTHLVANARDAMPRGGNLSLQARSVERTSSDGMGDLPPGRYALVVVSDTGEGLDKYIRDRIFEPFFSTKDESDGLGLASAYGIVRQSGGTLRLRDGDGPGTSFEILLPLADGDATSLARTITGPHQANEDPGGSETILLVEDDADVRDVIASELEDRGYVVLQAADTASALQVAAGHRGEIHLLLADVILPGVDGTGLARRLGRSRGTLRTLYLSGHDTRHLPHDLPGTSGTSAQVLRKPITAAELARAIRALLDPS